MSTSSKIILAGLLQSCLVGLGFFWAGLNEGRKSVQSANDLIVAGFTIIDPEGYEVEGFDGGDWWTTEPRQ